MSKGNTFENDLLKLIFQAIDIANIADDAATSPLTNLYVSLHTSDPGETGDQSTNEVSTSVYENYARVAVARSSGGWAVSGNVASPVADIEFAAGVDDDSATLTHFGIGTAASSTGKLLYKGALTPNISLAAGVTPKITTDTTITED